MTMLERIARALCAAQGNDPDFVAYVLKNRTGQTTEMAAWTNYRRMARAAVEAMREPTEAMNQKLQVVYGDPPIPGDEYWDQGIDAILDEQEPPPSAPSS